MATTEHTINDALASVLGDTRRAWRETPIVRSENTGVLKGNAKRPDILIIEPNVSPVVIETEVEPAVTVEQDAVFPARPDHSEDWANHPLFDCCSHALETSRSGRTRAARRNLWRNRSANGALHGERAIGRIALA